MPTQSSKHNRANGDQMACGTPVAHVQADMKRRGLPRTLASANAPDREHVQPKSKSKAPYNYDQERNSEHETEE